MSNYKIIDSNILLDYPQIIQKEDNLVIATDVLRELDGLKKNNNSETAFKARRAAIVISRNLNKLNFDESIENEKLNVDDKLLNLTKSYAGTLITNDVYLKVKATIAGLQTHGYGGSEGYSGIIEWTVNLDENLYSAELEEMLNTRVPPKQFSMRENQYLIVKSPIDVEILGIYVWRKNRLEDVLIHDIRNRWINKISPRSGNAEQVCLFEALYNKNSTIVYAGGTWGCGKSFILNNFALQELELGHINKIVYIPNNSYVANTINIGALPGEKLDKVSGSIGPLVDLIGIDEINRMEENGELEIVPMSFARGRSFENCIIIVNEAQNLTDEHIKLLIARCGDGTRIFLDGDEKQADTQLFKNKSGLKLLLKLSESEVYSKLFSVVKMNKIERSITAQAAGYLDSLTGKL